LGGPSWPDHLKVAREPAFGKVASIGAADHARATRDRGRDEMDVVGVEPSADHAQLLSKVIQQILASPSREVVHHLTDRSAVQPRLLREL
jgi:hypothetical protein